MIVLYVLIALLVLLVMITVHEFGHYSAAKLLGFDIDEFSIGFGPKLFQRKKKNGELFSIRLLPLGGYCAFTGEEKEEVLGEVRQSSAAKQPITNADAVEQSDISASDKTVSRGYGLEYTLTATPTQTQKIPFDRQKPWKRLVVMLSGPLFNLLSAFLFSFIFIISVGYASPSVTELYVNPDTGIPYASELCKGDIITAVNGRSVSVLNSFNELVSGVKTDESVVLTIERDGKRREVTVNKQKVLVPGENGYTEAELFGFVQDYTRRSVGFFQSIGYSFPYTFKLCGAIFQSLGSLLTGKVAITDLSGPIGTVTTIATYTEMSWQYMLLFLPLLACNLAIFNILPIPSLDGARAIFVIIEWIRKKPINKKVENAVHTVGLMLLLGFVVIVDVVGFLVR